MRLVHAPHAYHIRFRLASLRREIRATHLFWIVPLDHKNNKFSSVGQCELHVNLFKHETRLSIIAY